MLLRLQIIVAIILVLGLLYVISLIRNNRLELRHAISWILVGIIVLILDCFPTLMEKLSELLGIASPVNMMFFLAFLFSLVIILVMSVAISIASSSIKKLVQEIGILKARVDEFENKARDKENGD